MKESKTTTILQRVPKILAVTAASYGLTQRPQQAGRAGNMPPRSHPSAAAAATPGKPH